MIYKYRVGEIVAVQNDSDYFRQIRYELITSVHPSPNCYYTKLLLFENESISFCNPWFPGRCPNDVSNVRHSLNLCPIDPIKLHQIKTFLAGNQL